MRDNPATELLRHMLANGSSDVIGEVADKGRMESPDFHRAICSLEECGFVFRREREKILLLEEPDSLVPQAILARLRAKTIGREIVVFRETSSTNDRVRQAGIAGAAEGLVVFAESQTKGRGTHGRKWVSEPGKGLWFSILLRSDLGTVELPRLLRMAAVACAEVIERRVRRAVYIKAPNDLILGGGKLAGFLLETCSGWDFQVLGIGINTRSAPLLPGYPTASMEDFSAFRLPRNAFAAELLDGLENWYFGKSGAEVELAFRSRSTSHGLGAPAWMTEKEDKGGHR